MASSAVPGPAPSVDEVDLGTASAEFADRLRRAIDLATNPPKVAVGTTPHTVVYEEDRLKLLRYDRPADVPDGDRPAVLLIYALINKPYIMDLQPGLSVVETLLNRGLDVFLIDWGTPNELDKDNTVNDYVNGYIHHCVREVQRLTGDGPINILGYCQGGTFSAMYAALHPEEVRNLALMAAPLVWQSNASLLNVWAKSEGFDAWKIARTFGLIPAEFFNQAWAMLDPIRTSFLKFRDLILHIDDPAFVENFLRMEMWTVDAIPMAGPTYAEIVTNGYQQDRLVQGTWELGGRTIDLKKITMPLATIVGLKDNMVPAETTSRVAEFVGTKDITAFAHPSGHIGLSVSRRAHTDLWPRVADWYLSRSRTPSRPAPRPSSRRSSRQSKRAR